MKPQWARNIVTALARVGGRPIGVLANQPMVLGGARVSALQFGSHTGTHVDAPLHFVDQERRTLPRRVHPRPHRAVTANRRRAFCGVSTGPIWI